MGQTELQADPSFDQREFAIQYNKNKARWDKAFDFLKHEDLSSLTVGVHELDGQNVFVKVTEYDSKNREDVLFEAHRDYTDIHYIVTGVDIERAALADAIIKTPYNAEKDIVFYEAKENQTLLGKRGTFFIIFSNDPHRSGIKVDKSVWVKKIVVKIKN
ncbi:MAG: YhcH/YjgK/YiaL family protein [Peptostreptococcaceae bacterium]|nr:YhcH/YjgK/YiaL family protein [Peptostreptococcaceae bacterium]